MLIWPTFTEDLKLAGKGKDSFEAMLPQNTPDFCKTGKSRIDYYTIGKSARFLWAGKKSATTVDIYSNSCYFKGKARSGRIQQYPWPV